MQQEVKIVIAYTNSSVASEMAYAIEQEKFLKVVAVTYTGDKVLPLVKRYNPEFLILDITLPVVDGIEVLSRMQSVMDNKPFIITYCAGYYDLFWNIAYKSGADIILQKPADPNDLVQRIIKVYNVSLKRLDTDQSVPDPRNFILEKKITHVLNTLGIPVKYKGFQYIREALVTVLNDNSKLFSVTKILYPDIGGKFGVSSRSVENSITKVIQSLWFSENKYIFTDRLGCNPKDAPPTNVEFLYLISDAIRLEMI